jgi:hypothetical protein
MQLPNHCRDAMGGELGSIKRDVGILSTVVRSIIWARLYVIDLAFYLPFILVLTAGPAGTPKTTTIDLREMGFEILEWRMPLLIDFRLFSSFSISLRDK